MSESLPLAFVLTIAALAGIIALFVGVKIGMYVGRVRAERAAEERIGLERLDAVKRSRAVLGGQFSEQLSPYLPGFPGDPTEVRFVGKPVDFISFAGASRGSVDEVVFIEVKSGDSRQSAVERSLRNAIEQGRVRYVEYRVPARRPESRE
jgi:predicted Holliday junction resolvase-like endonuclease